MIKLGKPKGQNVQEIDFMVVNYTHQYILNIEAKKWLGIVIGKPGDTNKNSILKVKNQLAEIKAIMKDWFGADLKGNWCYISALYCQEMEKTLRVWLLQD